MRDHHYFVYILSNFTNTVVYIGVTDLETRVYQHKNKLVKGFTQKYCVDKLVYFEEYNDISRAIATEKQLKNWQRAWKKRTIPIGRILVRGGIIDNYAVNLRFRLKAGMTIFLFCYLSNI